MPIYGNHLAWRFGTFAVPCFRAYRDHILADVLSGYADIDERAERVAEEVYERMGAQPAGEDCDGDMSEAAEVATERGQFYYEMMTGMRQATINLHTAGMFHLLEQQLGNLIAQVLDRGEKLPGSKVQHYADWLRDHLALDLRSLPQWSTIEELQLVCNAVKHAEGRSEQELRTRRPGLFEHPIRAEMGLSGLPYRAEPLRLPLAGD